MNWPATTRYELEAAPGSLALVQDFVNTIPAGMPRGADLLADLVTAQAWLESALAEWSRSRSLSPETVSLGESDLVNLRGLRSTLVDLMRAVRAAPDEHQRGRVTVSAPSALRLDDAGQVHALPGGKGWRHLASILLIEMHEAQVVDRWRRLKTCSNHGCSAAFFDRSRNNSRVWHDVTECGNRANLQAHRERRKAEGGPPG